MPSDPRPPTMGAPSLTAKRRPSLGDYGESGGGPGVWAASYRPATVNCPLTRIRHGPGRKPAGAWVTLWVTPVAQTTPSTPSGRGRRKQGKRLDQDKQLRR
jgi:hypothetical protein